MKRRRREFSAAIKRQAFARSRGYCECARVPSLPGYGNGGCGVGLIGGAGPYYEHIQCDALGGAPTLENCAALCLTCWKHKTARHDLPVIAKDRRQGDRAHGIRPTPRQVLLGTFRSGVKLPMNGSGPIDRATGKPLFPRRGGR